VLPLKYINQSINTSPEVGNPFKERIAFRMLLTALVPTM